MFLTTMKALRRAWCPVCRHQFLQWNVFLIGRWMSIRCPHCHARLCRRVNAQSFLVGLVYLVFAIPVIYLELWNSIGIVILIVAMACAWLVDVLSIKLHSRS